MYNQVQDWYYFTYTELMGLWAGFLHFIAVLIPVLVVLLVGWFISSWVGVIVTLVLEKIKFNQLFAKDGLKKALEKAELKVNASEFIGTIFKWVLFIVFLSIAAEIIGLTQFAIVLNDILNYLPNVLVAALIFVVAVVIADIVEKLVRTAIEGAKVAYGNLLGAIVRWAIWIVALFAILEQLGVAKGFVQTVYTGVVAFLVISFGIAFGLGGKDVATELLEDLKKKFKA